MRIVGRLLIVALTAVVVFPAVAAAEGAGAVDGYWFCYSMADQDPVYVTPVWDKKAVQDDVQLGFKKVLGAKYNYQGIVMCSVLDKAYAQNTLAKAEETKAQQVAAWQKGGTKIVQTGWTSNEPRVGPAAVHWSACGAMILAKGGVPASGPFEMYVSAPFDAGNATVPAQQAAFEAFLRTKYGITTTSLHAQCTPTGDEDSARSAIKFWMDKGSRRGKAIDTGWEGR